MQAFEQQVAFFITCLDGIEKTQLAMRANIDSLMSSFTIQAQDTLQNQLQRLQLLSLLHRQPLRTLFEINRRSSK